jgi:succinate dehydrogenase flavin-adding protein (antitoxin of CptAB toxin-antitoxin module)
MSTFKKNFYRATHRGTKELDLIMIDFMNNIFEQLTQPEIEEFEKIVASDDYILDEWVSQKKRNLGTGGFIGL